MGCPIRKVDGGGGGGGGGGGCCECPLETILPNFGLGRGPNSFALLKSLSQYHTVLRCNMQISRIKAVDNGAGAVTLKHPQIFRRPLFFLTMSMFSVICN